MSPLWFSTMAAVAGMPRTSQWLRPVLARPSSLGPPCVPPRGVTRRPLGSVRYTGEAPASRTNVSRSAVRFTPDAFHPASRIARPRAVPS